MPTRKRGVSLLLAGGVAIFLGTASLVVGFLISSLALTYASVACSVLAAPLMIGGVVLVVVDHR